jgi:hypothetical protein
MSKYHSMFPPPVACATFAGGETIRMSFWQPANKPWRFAPIRAWLCQVIGNERGRNSSTYSAAAARLDKKISAARQLANRGATHGEREAGTQAMARLERRRQHELMEASFSAFSERYGRRFRPADDLMDFWVEHDGKSYRPETLPSPISLRNSASVAPSLIISKMRALIDSYGESFPDECRAARNFITLVERIAA